MATHGARRAHFPSFRGAGDDVWLWVGLMMTGVSLMAVSAAFAAVITFRNWNLLSKSLIAAGLLPWIGLVIFVTPWLPWLL